MTNYDHAKYYIIPRISYLCRKGRLSEAEDLYKYYWHQFVPCYGNYTQFEDASKNWEISRVGFENMQILKKACADTLNVYKNKKR